MYNELKNQVFEVGQSYEMRYIGDSNLRPQWKCIKRTAKMATFTNRDETITRRIKYGHYDNNEYVNDGNYSMTPSIGAEHKVKA